MNQQLLESPSKRPSMRAKNPPDLEHPWYRRPGLASQRDEGKMWHLWICLVSPLHACRRIGRRGTSVQASMSKLISPSLWSILGGTTRLSRPVHRSSLLF